MIYTLKKWYKALFGFFPIQLLLIQLKKGHLLLLFWLLIYALITGLLAKKYGGAYLFLSPEYLDQVNPLSFFLLGGCFGFFTMAFHISSYIHFSFRFPFLATLSRPLYKFSVNNSVIPAFVIASYLYEMIRFWVKLGEVDAVQIAFNGLSFIIGIIVAIALIFTYFMNLNKSYVEEKLVEIKPLKLIIKQRESIDALIPDQLYKVRTYMNGIFSINLVRRTEHYNKEFLLQTLQQHHMNAAIYAVVVFLALVGLSFFKDGSWFMIPAGGSVLILFALYLMVTGALVSRFKGWTTTIIVLLLVTFNALSTEIKIKQDHQAYGLNYDTTEAVYNYPALASITTEEILESDSLAMIEVLEAWKAKNMDSTDALPKMVFINTSGGGQRSALWTVNVMQAAEEKTGFSFMKHCHMITGSSGGMLGASYLRELYRRGNGEFLSDSVRRKISKDLLNPVVFSLVVNDLFVNFRKWEDKGHTYRMDRGFAFEQKLNNNLSGVLDQRLGDYYADEKNSRIPMMILSPSLVNEARRLLISPLPLSFLTVYQTRMDLRSPKDYDGVELRRMFAAHQPDNLRFTTALRMSATFPYITPLVSLPSSPKIKLIDAGVRDNTGFELSFRYLFFFREWIEQNTSGVVFVQINSDRVHNLPIELKDHYSKLESMLLPASGAYDAFLNIQLFTNSQLKQTAQAWFNKPIDILEFSLLQKQNENLALSWHLTEKEKSRINNSIFESIHQNNLELLKALID